MIYLLSRAGLIKQPHQGRSDDATPGLSLLEAANWLSNCWKIMNQFLIGWSVWLPGRVGRGRNWMGAGPFQGTRRSELEAVQTGQSPTWGSWHRQPQEFADSSYLTQSFCCCGKCDCRILLPSAVCRHVFGFWFLFLTPWKWEITVPRALCIQPKPSDSSEANSCMDVFLTTIMKCAIICLP